VAVDGIHAGEKQDAHIMSAVLVPRA
jgi:hypothetical protein